MQTVYNASQKVSEHVTEYGCRLEALLQVAVESGHVSFVARNNMLCSKCWTGLRDEKLKILTRNKYHSTFDYHSLLKEARSVEHELSASSSISATVNTAKQSTTVDKKTVDDLTSKIDLLMNKMLSLEKQMKETPEDASGSSNNELYCRDNNQNRQGGYTPNCGNYHGANRDSYRGGNRGRYRVGNSQRESTGSNKFQNNPKA
ncbi:hypothetical protein DPMN_052690 [Dreissena polymorpha]|uniref:Uncharacterized protein n=1 Tax=Dreissena polymorpha TaxID=45954 RepID=A0A9D4HQ35_DREPO|nr:hypothetical protein DPMN_052690 [Dreissena polymorpha]